MSELELQFEEKHKQADIIIKPTKGGIKGQIAVYLSPTASASIESKRFWGQVADELKEELE
jgi:hypothetical protein